MALQISSYNHYPQFVCINILIQFIHIHREVHLNRTALNIFCFGIPFHLKVGKVFLERSILIKLFLR